MKKAIIFDLDGTLLNTLTDISEAVNFVLNQYDFPIHEELAYRKFIGNGIEVLARKSAPKDITEDKFIEFLFDVKETYRSMQNTKTAPYHGILDLLKRLNTEGIRIAVLSNKPNEFMEATMNRYFSEIKFEVVFGARIGVEPKPNPEGVYEILDILNLEKSDCFFVGDTSTDIKTGVNASVDAIGVTWGFTELEEIKLAGANYIVNHPKEIFDLL